MVFGRFKKQQIVHGNNRNDNGNSSNDHDNLVLEVDVFDDDTTYIENKYSEDIDIHFNTMFPGRKTSVILNNKVNPNIEVNLMHPSDDEDFIVVYTSGISSVEMKIPNEYEKKYPEFKRAEVFLFLPNDWDVDDMLSDNPDITSFWPVWVLLLLSKITSDPDVWFGPGHTVGISDDQSSLAPNTKLSSVVLVALGNDISVFETKDKNLVTAYLVLPLYRSEMEFTLKNGYDAFIKEYTKVFTQTDGTQWVIDIDRKNIFE